MTAPLTPGTHTVIVDARLFVPGQPLFEIPDGNVVTEATWLTMRPDGHVEFRVRVGEKRIDSIDNQVQENR
jgi:hypothetical protein